MEPNSLVSVDPPDSESLPAVTVRSIEGFFLSCRTLDFWSSGTPGTSTFPPSGFLSEILDSPVTSTLGAVARLSGAEVISRRLTRVLSFSLALVRSVLELVYWSHTCRARPSSSSPSSTSEPDNTDSSQVVLRTDRGLNLPENEDSEERSSRSSEAVL